MIKVFIYKNIKILLSIFIMILLPTYVFNVTKKAYMKSIEVAKLENEIKIYMPNSYKGDNLVTSCYPMLNDVVIIGDSYAFFLGYYVGLDLATYCVSGLKVSELESVFNAAIKTKRKYAVIFIGPNDFRCKTKVNDFKNALTHYIDEIKEKMGAKVILSTYMSTPYTEELEKHYEGYTPLVEYSDALLSLVNEEEGIYYLDISMLNDYKKYGRTSEDPADILHFNKEFNIAYINKLYDLLIRIKRDEIGKM